MEGHLGCQTRIDIAPTFATVYKLNRKLEALDQKHDAQFKVVFDTTCQLMAPEPSPRREIEFRVQHAEEPSATAWRR